MNTTAAYKSWDEVRVEIRSLFEDYQLRKERDLQTKIETSRARWEAMENRVTHLEQENALLRQALARVPRWVHRAFGRLELLKKGGF